MKRKTGEPEELCPCLDCNPEKQPFELDSVRASDRSRAWEHGTVNSGRLSRRPVCRLPQFSDPMAASDSALAYRHRKGIRLEPYICPKCHCWHLRLPVNTEAGKAA